MAGESPIRPRPPRTRPSSVTLATELETGSGERLRKARRPALVPWVASEAVPAKSEPATSTAGSISPSAASASRMPPAGRMRVWMASHIESNQGILSAKNSMTNIAAAMPMIQGLASAARWVLAAESSTHWNRTASPAMSVVR